MHICPVNRDNPKQPKYLLKMKKITFILFALIAGTTFAQQTDSDKGTADVNAEIVSPISISNGTNLNFGRIIGNAAGGDVTIDFADGRTFTNGDMNVPTTSNPPKTASFDILAASGYSYSIAIPSILLAGGGDDMNVDFTHDRQATLNIGSGETQVLLVGGILSVNPAQLEGGYTAQVEVTVAYE